MWFSIAVGESPIIRHRDYTSSTRQKLASQEKRQQGFRTPDTRRLAAELGDKPKKKRKHDADHETGDDGKVESRVCAAMDDVAGQFSEAEGKLVAEIKKGTEKNEKSSEENQRTAEIAKRLHRGILP